jgi:site-specific recombinase XerD
MLYEVAAMQSDNPIERKAFVDEAVTRLTNEIDPKNAPVKQVKRQDVADAAYLRLTKEQAEALINAPGVDTLQGLRDTALIALMLCTGVREGELTALEVDDLRQELGGELALHIREGKGAKERLIPYGELDWCLAIVDKWLAAVGITSGAVFRGFYRGGKTLRRGRLSVRAVEYILHEYPIVKNGDVVHVKPHDCRRTYARRLYEAGADLVAIQQNLGHADIKTTLGYIGELDASKRRAPAVYSYDLRNLNGAPSEQLPLD